MSSEKIENKNIIKCEEEDYLDEDKELRGQKYACVSFISPESILDKKEVFIFNKFTSYFCDEVRNMFESIITNYPEHLDSFKSIAEKYKFLFNDKHMQDEFRYYRKEKEEEITNEFNEIVDFKTNVRGFKIRGSYETLREAQVRCEVLKRKDKSKHHIFIVQVGCWCPWDPCADNIEYQEYAEDELNTMMKKYNDNEKYKDEVFEERKQKKLNEQKNKVEKAKKQNNIIFEKKQKNKIETNDDEIIKGTGLCENNAITENYNETENPEVNEKVFVGEDPWIKRNMGNEEDIDLNEINN
jgi:hypothetical protein